MKNNQTEQLKNMYEQIITPECDVKDTVLTQIDRQQSVPRLNKKVLIAAIVCLILLMIGTAGATGLLEHALTFRLPNENDQIGAADAIPTPAPTPVPNPEDIIYIDDQDEMYKMRQFTMETQPGEFRAAFSLDKASGTGSGTEEVSPIVSDDYDLILSYLENSRTPLPIPSYIPKGYEFVEGHIGLYLDESILDTEPYKKWEEDGIHYYIFKLNEDYQKNIAGYSLRFKDKDGNDMDIMMHFSPVIQGGHEFGASATATAEYVDVKGFGESLLIYDKERQYNYMYELALYKDTDTVYSVVFSSMLYDQLMNTDTTGHDYTDPLENILILINADDIKKREILKIGNNLK